MTRIMRPGYRAARAPRRPRDAGFTLIDILFVVGLIGVISAIAVPRFARARSAAQSTSAIATMSIVNGGELSYAIGCGSGFYAPDLPTLGVPPPGTFDAFLSPDLSSAPTVIKSGYAISLAGTAHAGAPATCNGLPAGTAAVAYAAVGDPLDTSGLTPRFFGTNSDGIIYEDIATLSLTMPDSGPPPSGEPIK